MSYTRQHVCRAHTNAHLSLVDGDTRLGVEELGLQGAVHALVVLALRGHGQPVRGGVLHLEDSLQAVVIAQDIWWVGAEERREGAKSRERYDYDRRVNI